MFPLGNHRDPDADILPLESDLRQSQAGTPLALYRHMEAKPASSILTGRITQIGGRYVWLEAGTRVVVLPAIDMRRLRVGMQITVRAARRHGQFVAEEITTEPTPG